MLVIKDILFRRLYGVWYAIDHVRVVIGITNNYSTLGMVRIAVLEAKLYHFVCITFDVGDLKSENCGLIVDMRYVLSSLVWRYGCYRPQKSCNWYHWRLSCTWNGMDSRSRSEDIPFWLQTFAREKPTFPITHRWYEICPIVACTAFWMLPVTWELWLVWLTTIMYLEAHE